MSCNCENIHCKQEHVSKGEWSPCRNPTYDQHKVQYLGEVCLGCYYDYDEQYRLPITRKHYSPSTWTGNKPKRTWGCSNPNCGISTGFSEELTFGSGELSDWGYWEFPCEECELAWKEMHPIKYLSTGDKVNVRARRSDPGKGLSYPAFSGILLDDAGNSEGWDVVDVKNEQGEEVSVYCFSLVREDSK